MIVDIVKKDDEQKIAFEIMNVRENQQLRKGNMITTEDIWYSFWNTLTYKLKRIFFKKRCGCKCHSMWPSIPI